MMTQHGVFMKIDSYGVLIVGRSGIGKSELALSLIDQGHAFIADDIVEIRVNEMQQLIGSCPQALRDFLEVRGLGIINVSRLYGGDVLMSEHPLNMVIHLKEFTRTELNEIDRYHGMHSEVEFLTIKIPEVTIPVGLSHNLVVLVETAVRMQQLRQQGYLANEEFAIQIKKCQE
jgi:HPr kinase/phosphorylase